MSKYHSPGGQPGPAPRAGRSLRATLKSVARPLFRAAAAVVRPLFHRGRTFFLRPLDAKIDAISAKVDALSQKLEAIDTSNSARFDPVAEHVVLINAELTEIRRQLTSMTDDYASSKLLRSIEDLMLTLAVRSDRSR